MPFVSNTDEAYEVPTEQSGPCLVDQRSLLYHSAPPGFDENPSFVPLAVFRVICCRLRCQVWSCDAMCIDSTSMAPLGTPSVNLVSYTCGDNVPGNSSLIDTW